MRKQSVTLLLNSKFTKKKKKKKKKKNQKIIKILEYRLKFSCFFHYWHLLGTQIKIVKCSTERNLFKLFNVSFTLSAYYGLLRCL